VEEATRETGDVILVTEATRRLLRDDQGAFVERVEVPLKGKTERVRLYAPAAAAAEGRPARAADRPAAAARDAVRASRGR